MINFIGFTKCNSVSSALSLYVKCRVYLSGQVLFTLTTREIQETLKTEKIEYISSLLK